MTDDFLGRGWCFPIAPKQGTLGLCGGDEKIFQSIWLILSTAPGERVMRPEFGCGIHQMVFQPNTAAVRGVIQAKVHESLVRWEPRIDVLDVRVESAAHRTDREADDRSPRPAAQNEVRISVDYRIRANNALNNLVYPFYITEGLE